MLPSECHCNPIPDILRGSRKFALLTRHNCLPVKPLWFNTYSASFLGLRAEARPMHSYRIDKGGQSTE